MDRTHKHDNLSRIDYTTTFVILVLPTSMLNDPSYTQNSLGDG